MHVIDVKGSAAGTPGLTALDEDREASLADEGGASGATVESQDVETLRKLARACPWRTCSLRSHRTRLRVEQRGHDRFRRRPELHRGRPRRLRLSPLGALKRALEGAASA